MKNLGDDIIELINLLRPYNNQIERDKVFTGNGHIMEFKSNGREYLKKMVTGYISHFRGGDPLTFAEPNEIGTIPPGLNFTKVSRCYMNDFQLKTYKNILELFDDALDRKSQSVANFIYPGLSDDKNSLEGYSGEDGINNVRNQLKVNKQLLLNKINDQFFDGKYPNINELLVDNEKKKMIGGTIFKKENLKNFSVKFYECLNNINDVVIGKKGSGTIFIYSNLVKVGIELFREVLLQNGYLEFSESQNYNIQDDTIDSLTGITYKDFKNQNINILQFHPATFITFTGKNDDTQEDVPEAKMLILKKYFNHINNKDGKFIKLVLGSRVMNEGITLYNIKEVHLLDVYYNFGRVHQVIGRAIRRCVHYKITNDQNPFPKVNIYKYVVSIPIDTNSNSNNDNNILSAEEKLYQKAEFKYILVKDIERLLKEASIDCPLNYHGNIFPEEVEKYKNCLTPLEYGKLTNEEKKHVILCPASCDFQKCAYKCYDTKLNSQFYDSTNNNYKKIKRDNLDYTTFTTILKRNEVNYVKEKIKDLFKYKYVYILDELEDKIKSSYIGEKAELFDEYFVHQALDELIPIDENDFNNFQDTIYDKYNKPGYLIYRNKYYIFQPFDQNEDVPMWYRSNYQSEFYNDLTVYNFIKNSDIFKEADKLLNDDNNQLNDNTTKSNFNNKNKQLNYDFSNMEYYNSKKEFIYVGIIDKGSSRVKSIVEHKDDVFKLRPQRDKILIKKRGTGIPSLKGAVCDTSKDKNLLIKIAKDIGIENLENYINDTRFSVCQLIRDRLLFLEKFSTEKNNNKYVYMIIPANHPIYPFPLNLEDRINHIISIIQSKISISITFVTENLKNGIFEGIRNKTFAKYKITLTNSLNDLQEYTNLLKKNNFIIENDKWVIIIE